MQSPVPRRSSPIFFHPRALSDSDVIAQRTRPRSSALSPSFRDASRYRTRFAPFRTPRKTKKMATMTMSMAAPAVRAVAGQKSKAAVAQKAFMVAPRRAPRCPSRTRSPRCPSPLPSRIAPLASAVRISDPRNHTHRRIFGSTAPRRRRASGVEDAANPPSPNQTLHPQGARHYFLQGDALSVRAAYRGGRVFGRHARAHDPYGHPLAVFASPGTPSRPSRARRPRPFPEPMGEKRLIRTDRPL